MKTIFAIFTVLFVALNLNAQENSIKFVISEGGDRTFALVCGVEPNATWGLDTALGETSNFICHPPEGFDVALEYYTGTETIWSYKDLKPTSDTAKFSRLYYLNSQRDSDNAKLYINRLIENASANVDSVVVFDYESAPTVYKKLAAGETYEIPKYYDKFYVKIYYNFPSSGVEDNRVSKLIYPNPASDYIKLDNYQSINIYSEIGDLVYSNNGLNINETIDISSLKNGAYFVKLIDSDGKTCSGKLIKCN